MPNKIKEKRSYLVPRNPSIDRRYRPRPVTKIQLFNLIAEETVSTEESTIDTLSSAILDDDDSNDSKNITQPIEGEGALVYLRMRPVALHLDEKLQSSSLYQVADNILITTTDNENTTNIEKHYSFTDIFQSSVAQIEIYETCVRKKIELRESLTVLTYGSSGSGKTYTLLGDLKNPGIVPRGLENIFKIYNRNISPNPIVKLKNGEIIFQNDENAKETMELRKILLGNCKDIEIIHNVVKTKMNMDHEFETIKEENCSVFIWISFVEIYNENVYDLLIPEGNIEKNPTKSGLRVISNNGKVFIKNLTSVFVTNSLEAYKLLTIGLKRATYASTAINNNSSRSHCIFFVDIIKFYKPDVVTQLSYKFSDLAGSERITKTKNIGNRLREAKNINTSLMVLGRCLEAANNSQHKKNSDLVPVRESKLTMLLQAALLGHEKIVMIVNITPTRNFYEENLNVLRFASLAQNIVFKAPKPKEKKSRFSWLMEENFSRSHFHNNSDHNNLLDKIASLEFEVKTLTEQNNQMKTNFIQQKDDFDKKLEYEQNRRKDLNNLFQIEKRKYKQICEEEFLRREMSIKEKYDAQLNYYKRKLSILEESSDDVICLDNSISESVEDFSDNEVPVKKCKLDYEDCQ